MNLYRPMAEGCSYGGMKEAIENAIIDLVRAAADEDAARRVMHHLQNEYIEARMRDLGVELGDAIRVQAGRGPVEGVYYGVDDGWIVVREYTKKGAQRKQDTLFRWTIVDDVVKVEKTC